MTDLDGLLALATDLARRAGTLALTGRPAQLRTGTKSTPTDVVTEMDTAVERLLVDGIRAARPGDAILSEEGGGGDGASGVRWVVDPIDGTVNYLYGIPEWSVSIGVEVAGQSAVGVVYDAGKDRLYRAVRGRGATCNDEPLRCSTETDLSQALIATGFGYAASRRARQAAALAEVLPRVRDIRRRGAASLDLCAVAAGWVDGYYERGLSPWDLAAGKLIAEEAGARVAGLHGREAGPDLVMAAPPALFGALHDLIAPLGVDTDG